MTTTTPRPLRARATRIARALRTPAARIDAWVSTEAAVRLSGSTVLRPAVVVAAGEPPYDGVVEQGVLLVVEVHAARARRWESTGIPAVWAPTGAGASVFTPDGRTDVGADGTLRVPGHATLVLPADVLIAEAEGGVVVALGG